MNDMISEAQLLQASRAGNKDAFGTVVRRYQVLVCAVAYSATGNIGTSEDLAQETFIRAWTNLGQLEDPGKFRAWLCTIARNLARTSRRRSPPGAPHMLERATELPTAGAEPDETALAKERQEIVWAAVGRVPLKYREPLVLFYRRQQSVSEVAAALGLSEHAVRQRRFRIRLFISWWLLFFAWLGLPLALFYVGLISVRALGLCVAVYTVLLLALILWTKAGQRRIQREEPTTGINRQSLYGGVGGGIFGATAGLLYQAGLAQDWRSFGAILAGDILIFFVVTRVWLRKLQR